MTSPMTSSIEQPNTIERKLVAFIAESALEYLTRSNMVFDEIERGGSEPIIYAWPRDDRVVLIVDPLRVKNIARILSPHFRHHLSTILQGRRVVTTNHRGVFFQVAYWPEPVRDLASRPLDLSEQAQFSPLHVPIGVCADKLAGTTDCGSLWLSIVEMDAVLIGGSRRMGKTNLLHTLIAAMLQGKAARVILFDGKGGAEFSRYTGRERCQVIEGGLSPVLAQLTSEMNLRLEILRQERVPNVAEYNKQKGAGEQLERIVLFVDELAFALKEPGVEDVLADLIARGGAVGIHPVLATQRPDRETVTPKIKGNCSTRIALPVPARADSLTILDRTGAEKLVKQPGRMLLLWQARLIEAQAFQAPNVSTSASIPALPSARLADRERKVAEQAIQQGGWFKARELRQATGETFDYLTGLARKWELLGWLTSVQREPGTGKPLGRQVTDALKDALKAELGEQANLVN